jgi:hypothetical protein
METMKTMKTMKTIDTKLIEQYILSLNDQERKTLEIAKDHLGTSFNIVKSVGFIKWNETRSNKDQIKTK